MPAGKVGARDVTDFAAFDESVERLKSFFDGRERVEAVHVVDVDVVDAEAAEAVFAGLNQMMARGAEVVRAVAYAEGGFRGNENAIAFAGDGFAEDFFGEALGIDVGGVEEVDAGVEADVDKARGSATSLLPQALKNSVPPPKVPAPKLRTGTWRPE
jgi:hypothetical protein